MTYYDDLFKIESYMKDLKYVAANFEGCKESNLLLTGATGLIGSCIADAVIWHNRYGKGGKINLYCTSRNILKLRNRFAYSTDKDGIYFIQQDVSSDMDICIDGEQVMLDYIIHAASNSDPRNFAEHPVETVTANVIGINNILNIARKNNARVVYLSSRESYGFIADKKQYSEEDFGLVDINSLRSCYPESKRVAELLCRGYSDEYGVEAMIARLGYVYGPTMLESDSKVIAQFVRNALLGEDVVMKSRGEQIRSYSYMADVADGILKILFKGKKGEAYNVANSGAEISIAGLAEKISEACGVKVRFEIPDEAEKKGYSKPQDALLNEEKLKKLGYFPIYDIDAGLRKTTEIFGQIWKSER